MYVSVVRRFKGTRGSPQLGVYFSEFGVGTPLQVIGTVGYCICISSVFIKSLKGSPERSEFGRTSLNLGIVWGSVDQSQLRTEGERLNQCL